MGFKRFQLQEGGLADVWACQMCLSQTLYSKWMKIANCGSEIFALVNWRINSTLFINFSLITICLTFNNHHSIQTIPPLLSVTVSTINLSAHPSQLFYILPLFPQIKISKLFLSMTPVHLLSTDHMWPVYSHDNQLLWQLRNLILLILAWTPLVTVA